MNSCPNFDVILPITADRHNDVIYVNLAANYGSNYNGVTHPYFILNNR